MLVNYSLKISVLMQGESQKCLKDWKIFPLSLLFEALKGTQ